MKTFWAILVAGTLAALAGCASSHKTPVQTGDGTTAIGRQADAGALGAPIYPGATINRPGVVSSTKGNTAATIAAFKTADSFDRVYDFYRQQLPAGSERMKVAGGNGSVATFQTGSAETGDEVSVQVASDKPNETDILITHVTRKT